MRGFEKGCDDSINILDELVYKATDSSWVSHEIRSVCCLRLRLIMLPAKFQLLEKDDILHYELLSRGLGDMSRRGSRSCTIGFAMMMMMMSLKRNRKRSLTVFVKGACKTGEDKTSFRGGSSRLIGRELFEARPRSSSNLSITTLARG